MQPINRLAACDPGNLSNSPSTQAGQFEQLFGECESDLQAFIFTLLPNWTDAEDVLQRTRIVLWKKFSQYQPGSNFKAWALQVARYEVNNFRRLRRSDQVCFDNSLIDSLAEVRTALADDLERRRKALGQCLRKLRSSDRQIIRHCYGPEATTTKEAAQRLHRPVNTVYKALSRIRRTLSECVRKVVEED